MNKKEYLEIICFLLTRASQYAARRGLGNIKAYLQSSLSGLEALNVEDLKALSDNLHEIAYSLTTWEVTPKGLEKSDIAGLIIHARILIDNMIKRGLV